jgi:hypothetical protein
MYIGVKHTRIDRCVYGTTKCHASSIAHIGLSKSRAEGKGTREPLIFLSLSTLIHTILKLTQTTFNSPKQFENARNLIARASTKHTMPFSLPTRMTKYQRISHAVQCRSPQLPFILALASITNALLIVLPMPRPISCANR